MYDIVPEGGGFNMNHIRCAESRRRRPLPFADSVKLVFGV